MAHTLGGLRALLKRGKPERRVDTRSVGRNVMLHVTVDAQYTTPFREALIRDCGNQQWTLRVAPLRDSGRMRLSLYLPKADVGHAIQRLSLLTPDADAEVGQVMEMPDAPTDAWRKLMQSDAAQREEPPRKKAAAAGGGEPQRLAQLLPASHVLLGVRVADREALFEQLSRSFEALCDVPAATVTAGLVSREALGSTGLGRGLAVPHGHIEDIPQPEAIYVRLAEPIAFDAPDGQPVSDVVALLVPQWADSAHLHLLADVAQCFCDHEFREQLQRCATPEQVCRLFGSRAVQDNSGE
ncbi:MAG TPA: PTS sugar transporter subunit IIA [Paraburkholderia sp.]|nr:PTS sugar transporter subunit IIA [Paraburkholderia sp.]